MLGRVLRYTGIGILLAVLAVGPFFRGLFFWTELLAALTLVSAGFVLWLIGRRMNGLPLGIPGGVAGAALLALLGCYLIQFFWAVYPRGNIDWCLRVAGAWFAFVMVRAESGPALRRWLGWSFVLSAVAVGIAGFAEFTGYTVLNTDLVESLSLVGLQARMFTVLQYPNTAAVYFLAALFATLGLALGNQRAWTLGPAGAAISFLTLSFFFAVSRGAVVVLPFGLVVLFLGLERHRRWPTLLLLLSGVFPALLVLKGVGDASAVRNYTAAFLWIAVASAGGMIAGGLLALFLGLRRRVQYSLIGALVAVATVTLVAFRPSGGLLPTQAMRLFDINLRTGNVLLRLTYDKDATQLLADRPLGRGGWGWDRSYRQVQDFNYIARETHNHYAQTAVEAGIPGLGALVVGLGATLLSAWKARRGDPLGWTLAASATLIAGHSAIDFNLSYGAIWFLLWANLAASLTPSEPIRLERPARVFGIALGAGAAVLGGLLYSGARHGARAEELAFQGHTGQAVAEAKGALRYDRWDSESLRIIGDRASLARAAKLDPNNAKIRFDLALALERAKDMQGALREARAAVEANPWVSSYSNKVASLIGNLLVDAVRDGDQPTARQLAQELIVLDDEVDTRIAQMAANEHLWRASKLEKDAEFGLRVGQARVLTGDLAGGESLLKGASKVGLLGSEGELWLYVLYEKRNDKVSLFQLENQPWIRFRNANPVYKNLSAWL